MRVWRRGFSAAVVVLAAIAGATFPSVPATAVPTVIDVRVAASSDDAEESSGGSVSLTSTDLELVTDGTVVQTVGVRFKGLVIPKGATIAAAWIQFETDEKKSVATSLMIRAQAADNAATFVKTSRDVSSRPTTSAGVAWAPPAWNTLQEHGANQRTPDLAPVVQEIVNRTGWVSGNAMAFLIRGTGVRTAEAYNGSSPPAFHVEYTVAPPPNTPPVPAAGPDATVTLPDTLTLSGAVTDDGLPSPPGAVTTTWSQVSGPGTASFTDPTARMTTASFSDAGTYTLRFTASDGALSAIDDLVATVLAPDTTAPTAPTDLAASVSGGRRVELAWTGSFDAVGVTRYQIYRDDSPLGTSTTTSYTDATVAASTTYTYTVTASDVRGNVSDPSDPVSVTTPDASSSLVFAAAGDHGMTIATDSSLAALDNSDASFYLALGDLDYSTTPPDAAWCDYVHQRLGSLGNGFPFEVLAGNHEQDGAPEGAILNHAACLPDRMNATVEPGSHYGVSYFFDAPSPTPLMRVFMISPGLTVDGVSYTFTKGDAHYQWLANKIDDARASGIPWVVVGMHYPCLSTGVKGCGFNKDLLNLLIDKRVDLVLQGHDHDYQRSKQLRTNAACTAVPVNTYNVNCVSDDGFDNTYVHGAGTVFVIDGTFGQSLSAINQLDPERPYFAVVNDTTNGFMRYVVTQDRFDATFVPASGSSGQPPDSSPVFPIRAAFYYPWFPETWGSLSAPYTNYHPSLGLYDSSDPAVIAAHIQAMQYGGIGAGIASWWGQGTKTDQRVPLLLRAADGTDFRWSLYYEQEGSADPTIAQISNDLAYIADHYGNDPSYLRVHGKPVLFVYAGGADGCGMADRWEQANTANVYVVLKSFNGYRSCANQPDGWHQYAPASVANDVAPYAYTVSPGFWLKGDSTPRLARNPTQFTQAVRNMVASGARFQLITTFNEWGEGTSVESATEWASSSGFGTYLDILHSVGNVIPPPRFTDSFSIVPSGANQAPGVNAGADVSVVLPATAALAAAVQDDGLPIPPGSVTDAWSVVSGPGSVTFTDPSSPITAAAFSTAGTYVLRLTASDGEFSASDDLTVTVAQPGLTTTLNVPVATGNDDAEENVSSGAIDLTSTDLELIHDTADQVVGMRFANVSIPAGAHITRAYVQFETDETKTGATTLLIQGQASDDAATFTTATKNISSRPRTLASVPWVPVAWSILQERGPNQQTPDLAGVVQEIVSRPGWAPGHAIAVIITGTGTRTAEAFNGTAAPVLYVEYTL